MKKKFPSIMPSANKFRLAVFLLALTLGLTAAPAFFPPSAQAAEQLLQMDFKDADIQTFIKFISEATGRNFVVDPAVKGKITVYSPLPVSKDSWRVEWVETVRNHAGALMDEPQAWEATFAIQVQPPVTDEQILRNPGGIYVTGLSFSTIFK